VDAFTDRLFRGNPAAVCLPEQWPEAELMLQMAIENNLSETAFIVKEPEGWHLRWFTPGGEIDLCGHATLASGFVVLNLVEPEAQEVSFRTLSGTLIVRRKGDFYELDFPAYELRSVPVTDAMTEALGAAPTEAWMGRDLLCVFEDEETVRQMQPDQERLRNIGGRIQNATAAGKESDCVSRSFCPRLSIAEDPVCGSAHCQIAAYWSQVLGKKRIHAYQASKRGGHLYCELLENGRIAISGEAVLISVAEIAAFL
jgi:PhzF family phenazine biosynthesis protein